MNEEIETCEEIFSRLLLKTQLGIDNFFLDFILNLNFFGSTSRFEQTIHML